MFRRTEYVIFDPKTYKILDIKRFFTFKSANYWHAEWVEIYGKLKTFYGFGTITHYRKSLLDSYIRTLPDED